MIYSDDSDDYVVDIKYKGQLNIDIYSPATLHEHLHDYTRDNIPESRRIAILHKIDINDFIMNVMRILHQEVYLTKTEEHIGIDKDGNRIKIIRSPIRDIYEALQDLAINY